MKLGLINSAWLQSPISIADGIRLTRQIGFDTIDIFADPLETTAAERRVIRETCEQEKIPVRSIVGCALGIADFNKPVRDFHLQRAQSYLDLGSELGASNFLIVIGEHIWEQQVIRPEDQWNWAVENLGILGVHAASLGMQIAVEIEPFRFSIINNVDKMARFLDDVNHPAVGANIDISHLVLAGDAPERIRDLAGHIVHVHLSDCNGRVHGDLPPGRGCVAFEGYLTELRDAGFTGSISIELEYSPEPDKIVEWVREAYAATDALMSGVGIRDSA